MCKEKSSSAAENQPENVVPKKRKRGWKIFGIILAVLIVLLIALWLFLDSMIVKSIEVIGSSMTGTPVKVESFSSSLLRGRVAIRNLSVGNPEGCLEPNALQFTSLEVQVQLSSLFSDTVVVDAIIMDGLQIDLEPSLSSGSNLNQILRNVEAFTGTADKEAAAATTPENSEKAPAAPGKKVVIRLIEVRNSGIVIASKALSTEIPVQLPDLTMTDIGEQRSVAAAVESFFAELLLAIGNAVSQSGITAIDVNALGAGLSNAAQDAAAQLGEGLGAAANELSKGLSGAAESLSGDGLKSGVDKAGEELQKGLNAVKGLF